MIDKMALNSLLMGLEPRIEHILRAGDPDDIITTLSRIRRELQLNHPETHMKEGRNLKIKMECEICIEFTKEKS